MSPVAFRDCPAPEALTALAQGALKTSDRSELEGHLADCLDCQSALASLLPVSHESVEEQLIAGRYALMSPLGAGAHGEVWLAEDRALSRRVAVKLLAWHGAPSPARTERLVREAKLLAQLTHPRVLRVYDAGLHLEQPFLVTECITGGTLREWVKGRSWQEITRIFLEAGEGLVAAHGMGIIHRDFKPANVLVDEAGHAHVADFGLAQGPGVAGQAEAQSRGHGPERFSELHSLTASGATVGTPGYLAPEVLLGAEASAASDQYSFCVSLHEALVGIRPRKNSMDLRGMPRRARELLKRGLSPLPGDRFESLSALLVELRALLAEPARRRRRLLVGSVALALLSIAAGGWQLGAVRRCSGGEEELARLLSGQDVLRLQRVLRESTRPYAPAVVDSMQTALERYRNEWLETFHRTCAATRWAGSQSELRFEQQTSCLRRSATGLGLMTRLLANRGDEAVDRALTALGELESPQTCEAVRPGARLFGHEPVVDAEEAALQAASRIGDYDEAARRAKQLIDRARERGNRELEAEALYTLGISEYYRGGYTSAAEHFRDAALAADATAQDELRTRALAQQAVVVGARLKHFTSAFALLDQAEAAFNRTERRPKLQGLLHYTRGMVLAHQGRPGDAEREYRANLKVLEGEGNTATPEGVMVRMGLARALLWQHQTREAEEAYRQVLSDAQRVFGKSHPLVASAWNDLGTAFADGGRLAEARASYAEGERIQAMNGLESTLNGAVTRFRDAAALAELGLLDEALRKSEAALHTLEEIGQGSGTEAASAHATRSRVLRFQGNWTDAYEEARLAAAILEQRLPPSHRRLIAIECDLGGLALERGARPLARRHFESARKRSGEAGGLEALCAIAGLIRLDALQGHPTNSAEIGGLLEVTQDQDSLIALLARAEALIARLEASASTQADLADARRWGKALVLQLDKLEGGAVKTARGRLWFALNARKDRKRRR